MVRRHRTKEEEEEEEGEMQKVDSVLQSLKNILVSVYLFHLLLSLLFLELTLFI